MSVAELIIFDLDGTISVNSEFYRTVYSGTLESLILRRRSDEGLAELRRCRECYDGRGELALFTLNIPFREWADLLTAASLELIESRPVLCNKIRNLQAIKVIYTGSPIGMATRILERLGFSPRSDFDLVIGWEEPEFFPVKWTCSPTLFQGILDRFSISPNKAWAVGDVWDTDLMPAQSIGMRTAMVRKQGGNPDKIFPCVEMFLESIAER